ncbi:MAG: DUF4034 domain-containing protein [Burkholderiales bacterium]|nr:DUF4034 domain-containing protein [Burkholderiales bacterium]
MRSMAKRLVPLVLVALLMPPAHAEPVARSGSGSQDQAPAPLDEKALAARYAMLLGTRQYAQLEAITGQLLEQHKRKEISSDLLLLHLKQLVPAEGKVMLPDIEAWVQRYPASYAARYALGLQYYGMAWDARGGRWAGETTQAQFAEMRRYLALSRKELQHSVKLTARPYPSYRTLVSVAGTLSDDKAADEALARAVAIDPDAVGAYQAYINFNTPRWGGSYEKLDGVVRWAERQRMSARNLAVLKALVLKHRADDEEDEGQNPSRAADLFLEAYRLNPGREQMQWLYGAARNALRAKQVDRAISIYSKIIADFDGQTNAHLWRGSLYQEEKRDDKRAFDDMLAAARLGNKVAQNNVGYYYMTGRGVPRDLDLAKKYFKLSADQGFEHAREKLKLLQAGQVPAQ